MLKFTFLLYINNRYPSRCDLNYEKRSNSIILTARIAKPPPKRTLCASAGEMFVIYTFGLFGLLLVLPRHYSWVVCRCTVTVFATVIRLIVNPKMSLYIVYVTLRTGYSMSHDFAQIGKGRCITRVFAVITLNYRTIICLYIAPYVIDRSRQCLIRI